MKKSAKISVRIEPKLKEEAEAILRHLGTCSTDAITIFYQLICLNNGLPFQVKLPYTERLGAINELASGKGALSNTTGEIWRNIKVAKT